MTLSSESPEEQLAMNLELSPGFRDYSELLARGSRSSYWSIDEGRKLHCLTAHWKQANLT